MIKALKLVPDDVNINFIGKRFIAYGLSGLLCVISIISLFINGLNLGIDFTGGTLVEIRIEKSLIIDDADSNAPQDIQDTSKHTNAAIEKMRTAFNGLDLGSVSIQEFGQVNDFLIRIPQQTHIDEGHEQAQSDQEKAISAVKTALHDLYDENAITYRRVEFVGPQVGDELKITGLISILASLAGILIYVSTRFETPFGIASIIALAHDALITLGLFSMTQMEFGLSTVAALLMIAGYSINDTVVVFDRIRENMRKFKKRALDDLFNFSVNQTLSRTLITSLTTLLALIALWVFGGAVLRDFINALLFGIIIGTYSSVFVAAPILLLMNIRKPKANENDLTDQDDA